jgi:hypothetical protein
MPSFIALTFEFLQRVTIRGRAPDCLSGHSIPIGHPQLRSAIAAKEPRTRKVSGNIPANSNAITSAAKPDRNEWVLAAW